jgi:hypothetical protein
MIGIDLLGIEIGHDLCRPLAKDIFLKDIGERSLGIYGKDQDLLPLFGQVVSRSSGKCGLSQSSFSTEHDVSSIWIFIKNVY